MRIIILAIGLGVLSFMSCKKEYTTINNSTINNSTQVDTGIVVSNNITSLITFSQVQSMVKNETLKIRLNRTGFEVREYTAYFESATLVEGERLIYCRIPGIVIGSGDSGSPLYTKDGKLIGALCYGFSGDNHQFIARAIDDLLSISNKTKSNNESIDLASHGLYSIKSAYKCNGFTKEFINRLLSRNPNNILSQFEVVNSSEIIPNSKLKINTVSNIIPGMSATVLEGIGNLTLMGSTGTISYIDKYNRMYAYGHHYSKDYSPISAPVFLADMKFFVDSYLESFKESDFTDQFIGSMTADSYYGVLFDPTAKEQMFDSRIALKIYNNDSIIYSHTLSNNTVTNYEYDMTANITSLGLYKNRTTFIGKYSKVTGTIITKTTNGITTDSISFNTLTSNIDLDLYDVIADKCIEYTHHIIDQKISLSITSSTYADSVLVPIIKK